MALAFVQKLGQDAFQYVLGADNTPENINGCDELVDLQCGRTVFNSVPARMRAELWLSQMHRDREAVQACEEFAHLVSRSLPSSVQSEIEKDLHRTYPGHWRLSTPPGQRALFRVLKAYAVADPSIGYTQGMNFVAGLILSYVPSEAGAFGVFWLIMHGRGLRDCYKPDMSMLQVRLWQMGRLLPPRLAAHLEAHSVLPVLYASSWFLTCFASDFPLPFAARIMDLVVTDCYAAPIMKVALAVMRAAAPLLLEVEDIEAAVDYLKKDVPRLPLEELQEMLTLGLTRPWTPRQLAVLAELNGSETVAQAVRRVGGKGGAESPRGVAGRGGATPSAPSTAEPSPQESEAAGLGPDRGRGGEAANPNTDGEELDPGTVLLVAEGRQHPSMPQPPSGTPSMRSLIDVSPPAVPPASLCIEPEVGAGVVLDSSLSEALSTFATTAAAVPLHTRRAPCAPSGDEPEPGPPRGTSPGRSCVDLTGVFRLSPPPPTSPFAAGRGKKGMNEPRAWPARFSLGAAPEGAQAGGRGGPRAPATPGLDLAGDSFGSWKGSEASTVAATPTQVTPAHSGRMLATLDELLGGGMSCEQSSSTSLL
uniref:Rab-GAP TBC domain-containing protein n=1 Tax=Auxenochlorella protothecoides TaxID=3075 RepID=A0A1D1ZTZ1_AUXPR